VVLALVVLVHVGCGPLVQKVVLDQTVIEDAVLEIRVLVELKHFLAFERCHSAGGLQLPLGTRSTHYWYTGSQQKVLQCFGCLLLRIRVALAQIMILVGPAEHWSIYSIYYQLIFFGAPFRLFGLFGPTALARLAEPLVLTLYGCTY